MTPILKPERLNGRTVLKPHVRGRDGIMSRLNTPTVFHPPTISIVEPLEAIVDQEANAIVSMRAMKTSELRARLHAFALRVVANERSRNGG